MKFDKLLKKINQDVLMGIVIGIMLVILACFFGFCYSPKRTLLEGMENEKENEKKNDNSAYYNTVIGSMNSGCSVHNTQNSCNRNYYMLNNKKHSCKWDVTNNSCGFSNKEFSLDDFDGWSHSKTTALTPSTTNNSSSKHSSSSSKHSSS